MILDPSPGWLPALTRSRALAAANWRASPLLVLLTCVVVLSPLAGASLPDPTWVEGLYDAGDHDEEIVTATWLTGVVEPVILAEPERRVVRWRVSAYAATSFPSARIKVHGRSPPFA